MAVIKTHNHIGVIWLAPVLTSIHANKLKFVLKVALMFFGQYSYFEASHGDALCTRMPLWILLIHLPRRLHHVALFSGQC